MKEFVLSSLLLSRNGKTFKTPNHSKDRKFDDSHQVKKKILKAAKLNSFSLTVGNNPDIDIDENGSIILIGVDLGPYSKQTYSTNLPADDYFKSE